MLRCSKRRNRQPHHYRYRKSSHGRTSSHPPQPFISLTSKDAPHTAMVTATKRSAFAHLNLPVAAREPKPVLLELFPYWGMCYNRPRRGTCREARGGAGSAGACGERIFAARPARGTERLASRCFAILSRLLPAAGVAALQTDLRGVRLLHVLLGLLLICFAGPARLPLEPRSTRREQHGS